MLIRCLFPLLLIPILVACGGSASTDTANSQPTSVSQEVQVPQTVATSSDSGDANGLVARVNGVGISQLTFDAEYARRSQGGDVADPTALGQQVMDGLIEREIVRQFAKQQGITVSLDEARQEVASLKSSLPTEAEWSNFLTINNMTEPEMVNAQLELLVTQKVREQLFAPLYGDVLQAHARHIVVKTEAEANDILTQLQGGGNFVELAKTYSVDLATRDSGGDLGWFVPIELIDARLGEVIFGLQVGAIAGPIPTRIGYHIVQLIETATRPIEATRLGVLMEATYNTWLQQQFATAQIERFK